MTNEEIRLIRDIAEKLIVACDEAIELDEPRNDRENFKLKRLVKDIETNACDIAELIGY